MSGNEEEAKLIDMEDLHSLLVEKYGSNNANTRFPLFRHFEGITTSFQREDEELRKQIGFHERALSAARSRRKEVRSILGVLVWLNENLFATQEPRMGRAVRRSLFVGDGGAFTTYRMLMERLNNFVGNGPPPIRPPKPERTTTPEDEIPFWCHECGLGFRDEEDFERHKSTNCNYTGDDVFKAKRAAAEEAKEEDRKLRCPECGYKAKTPGGKATHMRKHKKPRKKVVRLSVGKKKVAKKRGRRK